MQIIIKRVMFGIITTIILTLNIIMLSSKPVVAALPPQYKINMGTGCPPGCNPSGWGVPSIWGECYLQGSDCSTGFTCYCFSDDE